MARGKSKKADAKTGNGNETNMGFEAQMFLAVDKLRKTLGSSDEKHVALSLIFPKYFSKALEAKQPILDQSGHLRQELLFHLRAQRSERCPLGWTA
jgi:type I restriction-modification system DNA methylase subunit